MLYARITQYASILQDHGIDAARCWALTPVADRSAAVTRRRQLGYRSISAARAWPPARAAAIQLHVTAAVDRRDNTDGHRICRHTDAYRCMASVNEPTSRHDAGTGSGSYDTIRHAILTCNQKLAWVSLIYHTEPTTKKWKDKNYKAETRLC